MVPLLLMALRAFSRTKTGDFIPDLWVELSLKQCYFALVSADSISACLQSGDDHDSYEISSPV